MKRIAALIVAGLLAASAAACNDSDGSSNKALPAGFPVYEGASEVDSGSGASGGAAVYQTDDDPATVQRYFEDKLREGGWTVTTETRGEDTVIRIEKPDDPAQSGSVVIREADGQTQIVETVGNDGNVSNGGNDDSGSNDNSSGGGNPDSTPVVGADGLPVGYPSDSVPLPDGITVTEATGPAEQGADVYSVDFDTSTPVDQVVSHFTQELTANGWTQDLDRPDSPFTLQFSGPEGTVLVTGNGDETSTHVNVTITLD